VKFCADGSASVVVRTHSGVWNGSATELCVVYIEIVTDMSG